MFIRLKTNACNDVNVNANGIKTFAPAAGENATGTVVTFTDGSSLAVLDSIRSIRGYVRKALFAMHTGGGELGAVPEGTPSEA